MESLDTTKPRRRQLSALSLSLGLHTLLLLGAYYCCIAQPPLVASPSSYSIEISTQASFDATAAQEAPTTTQSEAPAPAPDAKDSPASQENQSTDNTTPSAEMTPQDQASTQGDKDQSQEDSSEDKSSAVQEAPVPPAIDERGLYTQPSQEATGAVLELAGWMWDVAPQPEDDTEESGKIIFEIKIDEVGEVIAIKTLEKTVGPVVEKIYKDASAQLTFSKTADNQENSSTSTGKVTFVIRANK